MRIAVSFSVLLAFSVVVSQEVSADVTVGRGSTVTTPLTKTTTRGGATTTTVQDPRAFFKRHSKDAQAKWKKESSSAKLKLQQRAKATVDNLQGETPFQLQDHYPAIAGCLTLTALERGINKIFVKEGISFPAQLAGCIGLFTFLLLAEAAKPGTGVALYNQLLPGSNLLAKWFPVLFVPGLVLLPLAPSIGNGWEVTKFISVAVIGLFYSMLTTAYTVLAIRKAQGKVVEPATSIRQQTKRAVSRAIRTSTAKAAAINKPKAYRDGTMAFLFRATVVSGVVSVLATNAQNEFALPVRTIFFTLTTFCTYVWGARLPATFTKVVHPLILSALLTLGVIQGTSYFTAEDFKACLSTYKQGTYDVLKMGAGDVLMFLLGPSVVSFAISMFDRRQLLSENLLVIFMSVLVSSVGGLFGTAAFVRVLELGGKLGGGMIRLSTLSRNVTTALAIACTTALQGDVSLAILIVLITGVLGATICRSFLDALKIHDPVTRGLAVGGSAQGLGVTSMMPEPDAFPFAAISMILTAIAATVLCSIPSIKDALVTLSQGNL